MGEVNSPLTVLLFDSISRNSSGSSRSEPIDGELSRCRTRSRTQTTTNRCKLLILNDLSYRVQSSPYTRRPIDAAIGPESPTPTRPPARALMQRRVCVPHAEKFRHRGIAKSLILKDLRARALRGRNHSWFFWTDPPERYIVEMSGMLQVSVIEPVETPR